MRTLLVALALVGALPSPAVAARTHFDMTGCDYVEMLARVPADRVAALVPPDFTLLLSEGTAQVAYGGANCRTATTGAQTAAASFGFLLVRVEPPDDLVLRGPGVRLWFYRLDHLVVGGDIYQQVAQAAGVEQNPVDAIAVTLPPALGELRIDDTGVASRVTLPLSVAQPNGPTGGSRWREYHVVDGGYAVLEATLRTGGAMVAPAATVQPAPGTVAHAVFGDHYGAQVIAGSSYGIEDAFMDVFPKP